MIKRDPNDPNSPCRTQWGEYPAYLLTLICHCGTWLYDTPRHEWDGVKQVHKVCGKPGAEFLYKCVRCSDEFLKDFKHPAFHWRDSMCWKCLEETDPNGICQDYPKGVIEIHIRQGKVPPKRRTLHELMALASDDKPSVFSFKRNS